ncbi:MAG: cyanophycin synthetase [Bacteroidia bacterium]
MLLKELRVMSGPNMWSEMHKVIAVNLDYSDLTISQAKRILNFLDPEVSSESIVEKEIFYKLTEQIAKTLATLQPDCTYYQAFLKGTSHYSVYEYKHKEAGVASANLLLNAIDTADVAEKLNFYELSTELADIDSKCQKGPSTDVILEAARKRGISYKELAGGLVLLGEGCYQKRVSASIIESTGSIAVDVSCDKELTKQLLSKALLPVPKGFAIKSLEKLEELVGELAYPLVAKPLDGHQGIGITSNITNFEDLKAAFIEAQRFSETVIIEKYISGSDFRFLVIGYKLIAVAKRTPACVAGDGRSTIEQLVAAANADPKRGDGHSNHLTRIKIDNHTLNLLRQNNLTLSSVPGSGEIIYLKGTANISMGGTAEDVTDDVHPENKLLAERTAQIIGLDVCGIDIMAPDISSPITSNGGAIVEVNAAPGLRMHISPSRGTGRNVGDPIVDLMFPEGAKHKIQKVAITGTNGKTTTSRLMAHLAIEEGFRVGFTSTDGIYINNTCIYKDDCSGPQSAEVILQEPAIDFAVLECARGGIIHSGLAFSECDIAIVTNVASDHLGSKDIETVEDLAEVKSVVPRAASENGYAILNACDDLVFAMKDKVKSKVALFSIDSNNPRFVAFCENGGIGITMDKNKDLLILDKNKRLIIDNVKNVPITMEGKALFMVENLMCAVLAAYLLNFKLDTIKRGIRNFLPSVEQTPGRLNTFKIKDVTVIVDYAHNPHGLKALANLLNQIKTKKFGIITGVGDRRDDDIMQVGYVAASMYDEIIIRIDEDTRGRTADDISSLIKKGIQKLDKKLAVHVIPDSKDALKYAIENAKAGEYVVISAEDSIQTIEIVKELEKELAEPTNKI